MTRRDTAYQTVQPAPEHVQAMQGRVLLDFGTDWCGHCSAARAAVDEWIEAHPGIAHLRIEDGRGRPLGRAFAVKLWPTLVLLDDGREIARVVRPRSRQDLQAIAPPPR